MNETDVREHIVRPFLEKLGYRYGTEASIKTEQTFRYGKAFLGRKNPSKDPDLVGRADYILDVASYGRWVVEVKASTVTIDQDAVEQAHTYAAHPEVNALFFLLTNGNEFRLYKTSSLSAPLMAWAYEDLPSMFMAILNLVGPDAIKRRAKLFEPDQGKPLAPGIASNVRVVGGFVEYTDHASDHPLVSAEDVNGLRLPITGGFVGRSDDGRIHALVKVAEAAPLMKELRAFLTSAEGYDFYCSEEYISTDIENPTIFQNFYSSHVPAGTVITIPGLGKVAMPFGFQASATTEAIGFISDDKFCGTMELNYTLLFDPMPPQIKNALQAQFGLIPNISNIQGGGFFEVDLLSR